MGYVTNKVNEIQRGRREDEVSKILINYPWTGRDSTPDPCPYTVTRRVYNGGVKASHLTDETYNEVKKKRKGRGI